MKYFFKEHLGANITLIVMLLLMTFNSIMVPTFDNIVNNVITLVWVINWYYVSIQLRKALDKAAIYQGYASWLRDTLIKDTRSKS